MRSAVFIGAGRPMIIQERSIPVPASGQALIRVERCGICGSDIHMTSGSPFDVPEGTALGHEYAGEVVELGPGDSWMCVGDRVTALPMSACGHCQHCCDEAPLHCAALQSMAGGYSEYTLIEQSMAMRLPDSICYEDGALVEPLACGLHGVAKLTLSGATRVAVIGAGAIGAGAVYWTRQRGAGSIINIARSNRGEGLVRAVGADALLTVGDNLGERLTDALGGPPDVIIEAAGACGALQQAVELVRNRGTVLSLGGCIAPDTLLPILAMVKEVQIKFSVAYGRPEFRDVLAALAADAVTLRQLLGETISLDALPERFEAMRNAAPAGKVMVAPHRAR